MKKGFTIEGVTVDFTKSNRVRVNDTNYLLDEDALGGMGLEDYENVEISVWKDENSTKIYNLDENYNVVFNRKIDF
jgi:hypothetical protein|nr:hypothetical protein [uncultured Prevotella sp.]